MKSIQRIKKCRKQMCLMTIMICLLAICFAVTVYAEENSNTAPMDEQGGTTIEDTSLTEYPENDAESIQGVSQPKGKSRDTLNETEKYIYDILAAKIYEVVVDQSSEVSTTFNIPIDSGFGKTEFAAEDLGVSAIMVKYIEEEDESLSGEALNAMESLLNQQNRRVMTALLADYPYELYWCNTEMDPGLVWSYGYSRESILILNYKFSLPVTQEYAKKTIKPNGQISYSKYILNPFGCNGSIRAMFINTRKIISDNQSEANYERLLAYKNAICELTSNDIPASAETDDAPEAIPWELICLFDGMEDTNAGDDGYAMAFQYLNDQFSGSISALTVSGYIQDLTTGSGNSHLWNVVTMEDGNNYLVDVSNCDEGKPGYSDKLFLVGTAGSVNDGYTFTDINIGYSYGDSRPYSDAALTLSGKNYLDHGNVVDWTATTTSKSGEEVTDSTISAAFRETVTMQVNVSPEDITGLNFYWLRCRYDSDGNLTEEQTIDDAEGNILVETCLLESERFCCNVVDPDGHTAAVYFTILRNEEINILDLPMDLKVIESEAFADLKNVDAIRIPSFVEHIAEDAFNNSDIVIFAPDGTYAAEWAEDHRVLQKQE